MKLFFLVYFINENYVGDEYYFKKFDCERKEGVSFIFVVCCLNEEIRLFDWLKKGIVRDGEGIIDVSKI